MAFGVRERVKEGEKVSTRSRSSAQEKTVAKVTGGKQTPNSGATPWIKGDVSVGSLMLIECKTKMESSKSISIKKDWLLKNTQEKVFMGKKYSSLAFNFGPNEDNYYIIDEELFSILLDYLKETNNA